MIAVLQRVLSAAVTADGESAGSIDAGLFILLGVLDGDTEEDARLLAEKIAKLRIFTDENDKMNLSVTDVGGGALVVSNFTLAANYAKGNRPDYLGAAAPAEANRLYELFVERAKAYVKHVGHGRFGADMKVSLLNDGPVTIVMESEVLKPANKA